MSGSKKFLDRERLLELRRVQDEKLERAKKEHEKTTQTIDTLLGFLDENGKAEAIEAVLAMLNFDPTRPHRPSVEKEVLAILDDWPDDSIVTQSDIREEFLERHPEEEYASLASQISSFLRRLTKGKTASLELVEKGSGSRPARYRKKRPGNESFP